MTPKKSTGEKSYSKGKPFRTISKTDVMTPSSHDMKPLSSEKENLAIYIVLALAFISLVIYVTQIEPELAVHETTPDSTPSEYRDTASVTSHGTGNMNGFSCTTTERFDSDTQNIQIENYLKSNCDLGKPFNFSSSRFGDFKLPKSTICCWKK